MTLSKAGTWLRTIAVGLMVLFALPPIGFGSESLRYVIPEGWPAPPPDTILFAGICWLVVTISTAVAFFIEISNGKRIGRLAGLVGLFALLVGTFPVLWQADRTAKRFGVARVGQRAQLLLRAIEKYRSEHKTYPETLEALAPKYLEKVPSTGLSAFQKYSYEPAKDQRGRATFDLWVDTPQGVSDFDSIHYLNDLDDLEESRSEVVGDWGLFDD